MIICKRPDPLDDHLLEAGSSATPTPTTATSILTSKGFDGGDGVDGVDGVDWVDGGDGVYGVDALTGVTVVRVNVICEAVEVILRVQ